ncbi:MAG: MFS transporter [Bacteroidales bacterium]
MNTSEKRFEKNLQFYKFCFYGFLKNLRFYEPFLFLFFIQQGLTFFQIGVLISIREIGRNLLEIPAGVVADAIGRKRTLVSSFLFYISAFLLYFFAESYAWFIFAMIFYSLGDSFRTGTHKAMIFDYLRLNDWKDQKVFYYGHTRSYSQLGSALSSLIAALLVFFSGEYRMIFLYNYSLYF